MYTRYSDLLEAEAEPKLTRVVNTLDALYQADDPSPDLRLAITQLGETSTLDDQLPTASERRWQPQTWPVRMSKRKGVFVLVTLVGVALLVLAVAFASATSALATRSSAVPDHPRILYLAPTGAVRGQVSDTLMRDRGVTVVHSWTTLQSSSLAQPLDALLIDATLLGTRNAWDEMWMRSQFHNGVIMVGLGVDDDAFARSLGVDTFQAPAEANIALGTQEDLQIFQLSDWVSRMIRGELDDPAGPHVKNYATRLYGSSRGTLDSARDVDVLFIQLNLAIDGIYKTRAEYREQLKNSHTNSP
jgi:hypothetical protein